MENIESQKKGRI